MAQEVDRLSQESGNGFKEMSQNAEVNSGQGEAGSRAGSEAPKTAGDDNDRVRQGAGEITQGAGEQASKLQELLIEEVRSQPLKAIGWAAAAGLVVGLWMAR